MNVIDKLREVIDRYAVESGKLAASSAGAEAVPIAKALDETAAELQNLLLGLQGQLEDASEVFVLFKREEYKMLSIGPVQYYGTMAFTALEELLEYATPGMDKLKVFKSGDLMHIEDTMFAYKKLVMYRSAEQAHTKLHAEVVAEALGKLSDVEKSALAEHFRKAENVD